MTEKKTHETIPLKYPFEVGDKTVTELTVRRPRARDIIALETAQSRGASQSELGLALVASINGFQEADLLDMDTEDLVEVSERLSDFLPERLKAEPAT